MTIFLHSELSALSNREWIALIRLELNAMAFCDLNELTDLVMAALAVSKLMLTAVQID